MPQSSRTLPSVDVEIGVGCEILIVVDEVHHLFIGSVALSDASLAAPFFDGIGKRVIDILANIFKGFTADLVLSVTDIRHCRFVFYFPHVEPTTLG